MEGALEVHLRSFRYPLEVHQGFITGLEVHQRSIAGHGGSFRGPLEICLRYTVSASEVHPRSVRGVHLRYVRGPLEVHRWLIEGPSEVHQRSMRLWRSRGHRGNKVTEVTDSPRSQRLLRSQRSSRSLRS